MAVVTDRGQQLLIGGLVLALFLTALVIVLNGALYTDDLQTRDAAGQTLAADEYEGELSRELGRTLDAINDRRKSDRTALEDAVLDATFVTNDLFGRQYAGGQAAYATVGSVRLEDGIIIEQDSDCTFLALHSNCGTDQRYVHPRFTYGDTDDNSWVHAANDNLKLDASPTTDYDGTADDLAYDWTLTEGTSSITKSGQTPDGFTLPESGFWKVTLTVTDTDDPETRTATAWVAAHETDNATERPPRARFAHTPTVAVVDEAVELNATATTDGNGDITSYDWDIEAPDGSTTSRSGETQTFTPTATGDYTVTLDVSDATGNVDTLRKTVTVEETLADGGGRTGDSDDDGTPEPPFRVGPVPRDGYLALGESGAAPDSPDWTLAESATVRQFEIETTDMDALASVDDDRSNDAGSIANTFYVELTGSDGKSWELHIFESSPSGQFTVATIAPDGTVDIRARSNTGLSVDVTTGEVNGRQVFPFAPGLSRPYDIAFRNGDQISGSYELTLATGASASTDVQTANLYPPTGDREPYAGRAVYAINVPVTYDTSELSRRATVRVAPDEPTAHGRSVSLGIPEPSYMDREELVYVSPSSNTLKSIEPTGVITTYDAAGVQAIGPKQVDLDADGLAEIPYVASDGALRIIDADNETQTLVSSSATQAPDSTKTLIGIDRWKEEFVVLYAGEGDGDAYRVNGAGDLKEIGTNADDGIDAISGVTDIDNDKEPDILSADSSQQLRFYEEGVSKNEKVSNGGAGQGDPGGIGMGAARDLNGDGIDRAPIVDGSGSIQLISNVTDPSSSLTTAAQKAPVAGFQWDYTTANGEVMFVTEHPVDGSTAYVLAYVPLDGNQPLTVVTDPNGDPIQIVQETGVA